MEGLAVLHHFTEDAELLVREAVEHKRPNRRHSSGSPDYHDYRTQEQRISDAAYKRGSKYYVWLNIGECRYECMEELVKWMRRKRAIWHGMSAANRPYEIVVNFTGSDEQRYPPDIKMEELLRRMVKRYRYRQFRGPDSRKRAYDVSKKWTVTRERRGRKQKRKMKTMAKWASLVVQR
jgi:hypothetical protein